MLNGYSSKKKISEFLMSCKVELKVMGCPLLNQHKCGYCVSKINNVENFSLMVRHIIYILKVLISYIHYTGKNYRYMKNNINSIVFIYYFLYCKIIYACMIFRASTCLARWLYKWYVTINGFEFLLSCKTFHQNISYGKCLSNYVFTR